MITKTQRIALQTFLTSFDDRLSFHELLYKIVCLDLDEPEKHPEVKINSLYADETWKFLVARQIEELEQRLETNFCNLMEASK
jgi:hypothetical protein